MTIDEKDLYWSEELNKHDHKKFEVEVINTVKLRLLDVMGDKFWNLKPTFQAYVERKDHSRALIDLSFDAINIGLEVDEGHHDRQKEADAQREIDIFERMSMLGRKNYELKRVDVAHGYETKKKGIDEFVDAVLQRVNGTFEWDDTPGIKKYKKGDFIRFSDNFEFMTKSDLFNTLIQESKWGKASGDNESSVEKLYEKHHLKLPTKGYIQNTNPDKELKNKKYPYKFYIRRQDDWNIKGDKTERANLSRVWYNEYASDFSTLSMYTNEKNYKYTDDKKTLYAMFIGRGDKIKFVGIFKEIANCQTNFKKEKNGKIVQFTRVLKYERVSDELKVA